jgi:hypothetical protein
MLMNHKSEFPWTAKTTLFAAKNVRIDALQWLRAQNPPCPWDENVCISPAFGGHLEVLQWARAQDPPCPWDENVCKSAARNGHLEVLQWARASALHAHGVKIIVFVVDLIIRCTI